MNDKFVCFSACFAVNNCRVPVENIILAHDLLSKKAAIFQAACLLFFIVQFNFFSFDN